MFVLRRFRSLFSLALLSALIGCGGGSSSTSTNGLQVYVGKSYGENAIPFNGESCNLTLTVPSEGKVSGTLTVPSNADKPLKRDPGQTYSYEGDMSLISGGVSFVGTFGNLLATIQGTLPTAPSTSGGTFTITFGGKTFGPYPFGGTYSTGTGTTFTVTVLPKIAGLADMVPLYINSSGEVVGYAGSGLSAAHAFKWTSSGGMVDLTTESGFPKVDTSVAYQVNDAGQVCGDTTVSANLVATVNGFVDNAGSVSTIKPDTGYPSIYVAGIFSDGTVIADESMLDPNTQSYVGQTIGYKSGINTPVDKNNDVAALGVSPIANFATGTVYYNGPTQQWFTYTSGGSINYIPASTYSNFRVSSIPGSLVVGPSGELVVDRNDNGHIEIYGGPNSDLDTGITGTPSSINASGVITVNGTVPQLWSKAAGLVTLQSRIPTTLNLTLDAVNGINNAGQVICHGLLGTGTSQQGVAVVISPSN